MRIHLSGDDISEALLNAGIELGPEDQWMFKFNQVASDLTERIRDQMRSALEDFANENLR